jgi:hypothetical protein
MHFCVLLLLAYLLTTIFLNRNLYEIYDSLLKERHPTFKEFLEARYNL